MNSSFAPAWFQWWTCCRFHIKSKTSDMKVYQDADFLCTWQQKNESVLIEQKYGIHQGKGCKVSFFRSTASAVPTQPCNRWALSPSLHTSGCSPCEQPVFFRPGVRRIQKLLTMLIILTSCDNMDVRHLLHPGHLLSNKDLFDIILNEADTGIRYFDFAS